jgi:hypothetical protein
MEIVQIKKLGVWLDNSEAHLIEYSNQEKESIKIKSRFTHEILVESLEKSETIMHNKKRQLQLSYLKEIAADIKNYNEVLLFGPTEAKTKLEHFLKADSHFKNIKIFIRQTDYMTEHQENDFVKHFFYTNIS